MYPSARVRGIVGGRFRSVGDDAKAKISQSIAPFSDYVPGAREIEGHSSALLSLVGGNRIFRWWRSAMHLFRRRFLWRDWGMCCAALPGRSAFNSTFTRSRRSLLRSRPTFGSCPPLSSGTSLGRRAPFCSGAALYLRPLFPGRALGRRTFLTLRHMLPPV